LVRAVADFPVPVLTGIGHDKDIPLVSLVSDKNVSTPTAVANLLNFSWNSALSEVRLSGEKIMRYFSSLLDKFHRTEETLFRVVDRIESSIKSLFDLLKYSEKTILMGNPEKLLSRGYSIVRHSGKILRSVEDAKKWDKLDILVSDGIINSQVI